MNFVSDLLKLYNSPEMDPDRGPIELQRKVMFDLPYSLCRRGTENVYQMHKTAFELQYDIETKITYVKKVEDEMTKKQQRK